MDIRRKLGRSNLKNPAHGQNNRLNRIGERLAQLPAGDGDLSGQAGAQIAALDFDFAVFLRRKEDASAGDFGALGHPLTDQESGLSADIPHNRFIKLASSHPHRGLADNSAQREHRNVAGAAADVEDEIPLGLRDVDPRADGGGDGSSIR